MAIMVRLRHVRAEKICAPGMRDWFPLHGLSLRDFVANGLPVEVMEATDHYGQRVAARARAEAEEQQHG